MTGPTNASSGGIAVNVAAYASIDQRPAAAPENTVAVITDKPITGYVLSPVQPEAPAEGMVWLRSSGPGPMVASGSGTLVVLIGNALQYTGGTWIVKARSVYQSGKWSGDSILPLYDNGDENTTVTGGWKATGDVRKSNTGGKMVLSARTDYDEGTAIVQKPVPPGYSTVVVNVEGLNKGSSSEAELYVGQTAAEGQAQRRAALKKGINRIELGNAKIVGFYLYAAHSESVKITIANAGGKPGIYLE